MSLKLIAAPATEPLILPEVKAHLRVDQEFTEDDAYIGGLISAARDTAETFQGRAYVEQTFELTLDKFPSVPFELPRAPLKSVASIKYKDRDGVEADFTDFVVDADSTPGRIALKSGVSWPSVELYPIGAVKIRFVAGGDMPVKAKQAMLLLISQWYENREIVTVGRLVNTLPFTVESLLWMDRLVSF